MKHVFCCVVYLMEKEVKNGYSPGKFQNHEEEDRHLATKREKQDTAMPMYRKDNVYGTLKIQFFFSKKK